MHTVIGVSLLAAGSIAMTVANFTYWSMEAALSEKRPDLAAQFSGWYTWTKVMKDIRAYKIEFPRSHKVGALWTLFLAGGASFLSGFLALTNFK
jgi:hypothetical protein